MDTTTTEITIAFVGLGGVIAGALTTGGVQMLVAAADRRRSARASARLMLLTYTDVLREMHAIGNTTDVAKITRVNWGECVETWKSMRGQIALTMSAVAFVRLDVAVSMISERATVWNNFVEAAAKKPDEAAALLPGVTSLIRHFRTTQGEEANRVLLRACLTRSEWAFHNCFGWALARIWKRREARRLVKFEDAAEKAGLPRGDGDTAEPTTPPES